MTRRDAFKAAVAGLASFVLPAPRRHIDLREFCGRAGTRYDLTLPFELADWTYATDAAVCVRVRPQSGDAVQRTGPVPPFEGLSWNHAGLRGWREMPRLQPLLATDSPCPSCDETGYTTRQWATDCDACWATGFVGGDRLCRACGGRGLIPPPGASDCPVCRGHGCGTFPSLVSLEGRWFDAGLYEKARQLGCEFVHDNWNSQPDKPLLKFRFAGGDGLLMAMYGDTAERRVASAREAA